MHGAINITSSFIAMVGTRILEYTIGYLDFRTNELTAQSLTEEGEFNKEIKKLILFINLLVLIYKQREPEEKLIKPRT